MQKQRRRARGAKRGRYLAPDDAAFAHAGDDDASFAGMQKIKGALEIRRHRSPDARCQLAQSLSLNTDDVFANMRFLLSGLHSKSTHAEKRMLSEDQEREQLFQQIHSIQS